LFKEKLLEKIPLAVTIITKNEEENICACLQSVAFAGQVVIVDSERPRRKGRICKSSIGF
jgi:hypothetical protein